MSKWLDAARAAAPELFTENESSVPCANSANSANSFWVESEETAVFHLTALTARGTEGEKSSIDNPSPVVCIFCGQPVVRGTPGTGALNGDDLHMACYERFTRERANREPC